MIEALVYHAAKGLNQFPAKNGISDTLSPLTIMTGRANPDYNELKLEFGSYVQVFEDNTPSNTTTSRNTGAIVLNPETPKASIFLCRSSLENACPGTNGPEFP
jgi:hypothetical protein